MGKPKLFEKQSLRSRISNCASYAEIYISGLIVIGIVIFSIQFVVDIYEIIKMIKSGNELPSVETFLATGLQLIIGIEFVKMLAKHTPSSAVEVLLYAIARKIIGDHGTMLDALIGVIAITLLFSIRKFFSTTIFMTDRDEFIVNGGITTKELNKQLGIKIDERHGHTVAGIISNIAVLNNDKLEPGYEVSIDNIRLLIYTMDSNLIKQIKVLSEKI